MTSRMTPRVSMMTPLASTPNPDFAAPKDFPEFLSRYPTYLASYVRRRTPDATPIERVGWESILEDRLCSSVAGHSDRIALAAEQTTLPGFFVSINLGLAGKIPRLGYRWSA